jgi:hypothetical protein
MKIRKPERQNPDSYPYLDLKLFQNDRSGSVNNNYGSATLPRGILLTYCFITFIFQRNRSYFCTICSGPMTYLNLSNEYNWTMLTSVTDLNLFLETIAARQPEQYKEYGMATKVSSMNLSIVRTLEKYSTADNQQEKGSAKR